VPGRTYPIEVEYIPVEDERRNEEKQEFQDKQKRSGTKQLAVYNCSTEVLSKKKIDPRPYLRIMERIDQHFSVTERGDLLIFVSGLDEILTLADEIKKYANQNSRWIVLLLHSSISIEEQDKVERYSFVYLQ
jgi:HrpA-like RNA helicase